MAVRAWVIHGPVAGKLAAVAHLEPALRIAVDIGIAEPGPHPFRFGIEVGWDRKVFVFDGRIFFERALRMEDAPCRNQSKEANRECGTGTHIQRSSLVSE